jgi:hypothetical protein
MVEAAQLVHEAVTNLQPVLDVLQQSAPPMTPSLWDPNMDPFL